MHTLSLNFTILKFCGLWRPLLYSTGWEFVLYNCYTSIMVLLICTFVTSEFIELFASFDSTEEFAHASFFLLSMIGMTGKIVVLLRKRQEIIDLTNVMRNGICKPRDAVEIQIQADSERDARWMASRYVALILTTASSLMLQSIIVDVPERKLAYKGWLPYTYNSTRTVFLFTYIHQVVAATTGAVVSGAFDSLFPGLIILICAQMKILEYRFEDIPQIIKTRKKSWDSDDDKDSETKEQTLESQLLADCIRHHIQILQLADTLNSIFSFVIFLQFTVSSIVLCVSVYEVSTMELFSPKFAATFIYFVALLTQIFIFCFYGGRLSLQSMDICQAVYRMDWSLFGIKTKQILVMIMLRSQTPITFVCYHFIKLTLDSFVSLVKLSYSAFNVISRNG